MLALSEHRMKESEVTVLNMSGYKLCSCYSTSITKGGGSNFFPQNNIKLKADITFSAKVTGWKNILM